MDIFLYPVDVPIFVINLINDIDKFVLIGGNGFGLQVMNSVNDIATPLRDMGYYLKPIYDIINLYVLKLNSSLNKRDEKGK